MAAHAGPHRPENRQVSLGKTSSPGRGGATSRGTLDRIGIASLIDVHQSFEAMSEMGPEAECPNDHVPVAWAPNDRAKTNRARSFSTASYSAPGEPSLRLDPQQLHRVDLPRISPQRTNGVIGAHGW